MQWSKAIKLHKMKILKYLKFVFKYSTRVNALCHIPPLVTTHFPHGSTCVWGWGLAVTAVVWDQRESQEKYWSCCF